MKPTLRKFHPLAVAAVAMVVVIRRGAALRFGRLAVQVFVVPGHTAGSAAFLVGGVLHLGDSADSETDGTLRPAIRAVSEDTVLNVASLKALAERPRATPDQVDVLTFSHSGVLVGFGPLRDVGVLTELKDLARSGRPEDTTSSRATSIPRRP